MHRTIGLTFMNSGTIQIRWVFLLYLLLLVGHVAGAVSASQSSPGDEPGTAWTVEAVVAALKEARESSVSYEEVTYSSLLSAPLTARGLLRFTPPSLLEKHVLEPYRERYTIEGDQVTFDSERRRVKKTISLTDYPALRSFVEAFRAGFTGDAGRLRQSYELNLQGTRHKWTLVLRPLDPAGKSMVEDISFSGSEGQIGTIVTRAPDGDRSVMTLRREAR